MGFFDELLSALTENDNDGSVGGSRAKSPKDTGGPIVKTGPTSGKVRTRNKNGQWRRKRSDAGKPRK